MNNRETLEVGRPGGIYGLVVKQGRSDPLTIHVISQLEENGITTPKDLITTPVATIRNIFGGFGGDEPLYSIESRFAVALKKVAEINQRNTPESP